MRTTVTIDDELLAEAKLMAARQHRTIGSVLEDALRQLLDDEAKRTDRPAFKLPNINPGNPGLRPGIDLYDKEQMAELLGDNELPAGM